MSEQRLPAPLEAWFVERGWTPRRHQIDLLTLERRGRNALLIAPTGAGKTLAGFLPTLADLAERCVAPRGLHTLYISPLKALAVDVARNLNDPAGALGVSVRIETRTGDTPPTKRQRQRRDPPHILLTTPEQLALLIASADAPHMFKSLERIVLDELHAISGSKRGDLLALGLARLRRLAPKARMVGLSATVRDPDELRRYLENQSAPGAMADLVVADAGAPPRVDLLLTTERLPWSGHSAAYAVAAIYDLVKTAKTALIFVNTRAQAEALFQHLWRINESGLAIALHHGSLDASQRRRVESAMAAAQLKAVVCTSTLDLGVDWGSVDLVINVGAPKGSSRLMQRIGRSNHRLDEPSRAVLVPANHFETLECVAAIEAVEEEAQDTPQPRSGALDILCQHIVGRACAGPFNADDFYREVATAEPYASLSRKDFDDCLAFAANGGYALRSYDRFAKIRQTPSGEWRLSHPRFAQSYRMNVGAIVEADMLRVRLTRASAGSKGESVGRPQTGFTGVLRRSGRVLGEIEEYFLSTLSPNDTFLFAGEILALQGIVENEALVRRATADAPKAPSYAGGKFPLSTYLAQRVRRILAEPKLWDELPEPVRHWLVLQSERSLIPAQDDLLIETFPRGGKHYLVCYPFEGRLAHQTLGMLLTRRMERAGLKPLGFVASEYALAVWSLEEAGVEPGGLKSLASLLSQDMLGDDLEEWLQESALMKRTFRTCAIVAGLVERRLPGKEKSGRQLTISTDLIYDVLRRFEPDHVLLRAARAEASWSLLDLHRLSALLNRIQGRIVHRRLSRLSPLSAPLLLEIGREPVYGEARDAILAEAERALEHEIGAAETN